MDPFGKKSNRVNYSINLTAINKQVAERSMSQLQITLIKSNKIAFETKQTRFSFFFVYNMQHKKIKFCHC